eukprot:SAG11_NODE_13314_length_660_cov_1.340463_1_plen_22_part_10
MRTDRHARLDLVDLCQLLWLWR